jgi:hypothetical protein
MNFRNSSKSLRTLSINCHKITKQPTNKLNSNIEIKLKNSNNSLCKKNNLWKILSNNHLKRLCQIKISKFRIWCGILNRTETRLINNPLNLINYNVKYNILSCRLINNKKRFNNWIKNLKKLKKGIENLMWSLLREIKN